ncbi:hypothetical protein BOTCAL_0023g00060 [Botryotinia calthae]|uniref:Uncharacterized protein n=1 Tax=Botryotinia calthae TaxID=38488 RepID=A0A4Y8DEA2_9HELO|nr:hypothetical protein BOTCAL_0023g00060 [Botryotinia calthae]
MGSLRRRQPRFKITWWMRKKYSIKKWFSKLFSTRFELRGSIIRLRHIDPHPYLTLFRLFVPFSSWSFPLPEPVAPSAIAHNEKLYETRNKHHTTLRNVRVWEARDTPLRSAYRMYEILMMGDYVPLGSETEYFWYQSTEKWSLSSIPDPKDSDPIRYAVVACIVEELVHAFNWRLALGMRRSGEHIRRKNEGDPYPPYTHVVGPEWTSSVPPIKPDMLRELPSEMVTEDGKLVLEERGCDENFEKRNIITNVGCEAVLALLCPGLEELDKEMSNDPYLVAFAPSEIVTAGGFLAVWHLSSREATGDLNYIIHPEWSTDDEIKEPFQNAVLEGDNIFVYAAPIEWALERKLRRIYVGGRDRKAQFDISDAVAMLKYLKDAKGPLDREYIRTLDMNGFDVVPDDHTMNRVAAEYQRVYGEEVFA